MNARARTKADKEPFARINGFYLNAIGDTPDHRDYDYQPALIQLTPSVDPPVNPVVLDQGREGACTGFGLAAVINLLLERRGEQRQVSPRMLYEMARKFDEWEGEDYSGSSCRGAMKGWPGHRSASLKHTSSAGQREAQESF